MNTERGAIIGVESSLSGRFVGQDLTVLGRFDGAIEMKGRVVIGRQGVAKARIAASAVEIEGEFEGEIEAAALSFGETARARGSFRAQRLSVRDGAVVEGGLNLPASAPEPQQAVTTAAAVTASAAEPAESTAEPVAAVEQTALVAEPSAQPATPTPDSVPPAPVAEPVVVHSTPSASPAAAGASPAATSAAPAPQRHDAKPRPITTTPPKPPQAAP